MENKYQRSNFPVEFRNCAGQEEQDGSAVVGQLIGDGGDGVNAVQSADIDGAVCKIPLNNAQTHTR